ncbi:E3 ubiquitin-protein ligase msl-2-like [Drosophila miranda]|uniref:E3 ubiquitin-protein ligase msl-2-like n=1 Tax=Drosophila miranda TaxID=7229 RepID=UPI0007E809F6|nr:E3 ubiquitin-protein ligase msl-2-like [Drosophila miranda]
MTAQTVYTKVAGLAFFPFGTAPNLPNQYIDELSSGIGELRQLLSCVVCCRLLVDPFGPNGKDCQHYVCRLFVGGRKQLVPRCSQCEDCLDFETYKENRPMAAQLHCYQALCAHLLLQPSSMLRQLARQFPDLSHVAQCPRIRLPRMTTKQFLKEGAEYGGTPPTTAAAQTPSFQSEDSHLSEALEIGQVCGIEAAPQPAPLAKTTAEVEVLQENVRQEEAYWENVSDDEEYFGDVSQKEAFLENMSEETFMDSVTQEASQEIVSQDVLQESGSQATSRESIAEELYKEITSRKALQEQSAWDGMYQEIPRSSASQDIDLPEASQQLNSSQEYTPSTKYRKKDTEMNPFSQVRDQEPVSVPKPTPAARRCYKSGNTCANCRCFGCHNPHKTDFLDSDDEDELENVPPPLTPSPQSEKKELAPTEAVATATETKQTGVSAPALGGSQGDLNLVPVNNVEQSQHPLVLIENELGEYQGFNLFQGSEPIDPATVGFLRVKMQNGTGNRDQEPVSVPKPTPAAPKAFLTKAALEYYASTDTPRNTTGSPRKKAGNTKTKPLKTICRCGINSSAVNQKTCRTSRCRCYKSGKTCANCRCFGCHNPHKTDFLDSDDEDELENVPPPLTPSPQSEKKELAPTEAVATATETKQTGISAPALGGSQGDLNLVPVNNVEQSQHTLVLIENELGEFQGFNLFQGSEPIDPATVGFLRVRMQNVNSISQISQYAYVIPPPPVVP